MSEGLSEIWNELAAEVMPDVFDAVHTDTLNVLTESKTDDGGGAKRKAVSTANNSPIPCIYEPKTNSYKNEAAEQITSKMQYSIMFPRVQNGVLVPLKSSDRLQVLARGLEPQKLFRIVALGNNAGVFIEAICELEN